MILSESDVKKLFNYDGDLASNCHVEISDECYLSLQSGSLTITLKALGGKRIIKGFRFYAGNIKGSFGIGVGGFETDIKIHDAVNGKFAITAWRKSVIDIGKGTTSNGTSITCADSSVIIGQDCMFSHEIVIQSSDQHGIVDTTTGQILNCGFFNTEIHDHVWLGKRSMILPGVVISTGSVIAAAAVVTKNIPPNSIAAGVPARVIASNRTWTRTHSKLDDFSQEIVNKEINSNNG